MTFHAMRITDKGGDSIVKHTCSICGKIYEFYYKPGGKLPPNFPFCSSRCKGIDLGNWLNEEYRISTPLPNVQMMTDEEKELMERFLLDAGEIEVILNEDE